MANKCLDKNLLLYSGTSQAQRALQALSGKYAQLDERTAADLILFTKKYSAYLNYFDLTNAIAGDWQNIMIKDVAVTIASVADWRIKDFTSFTEYLTGKIKDATTDDDAKNYFKIFFDFVFSLASGLDAAYKKLPFDVSYTQFLSVSIASKLAVPLNALVQYYNTFKTASPSLINETSVFTDPQTPVDEIIFSQNFIIANLSSQWQISITVPAITLSGVVRDDINHIITHNLFTGALQSFLDAVINIINLTPGYLEETLKNYPSHEPHYALYLAFLRLFRFAQEHLNQYTQRHLDFYYKDVLRLTNNNAEPDFVHLVFELQKNIDQHLLKKGTQFKAGKDANNNDVFYSLADDIVVQKATVQALKSLFLDKSVSPATLFASLIANSEDSNGGKLLSVDNSWFPFGNPSNNPRKILQASIGFAIASNILYLNEGERKVTITFQCNSLAGISTTDLSEIFTLQFTGKKNWYTVNSYTPSISGNSFSLATTLPGDAPPIIPYSPKIHGGNFLQLLPMMQVLINNYKSYQKIKLLNIKNITVEVNATVKNLSLQSDDGKINPAKPFKPFGEFPESGSSFIIGSKEIFQKPLTELVIDLNWQSVPFIKTTVNLSALAQEKWTSISNNVNLFASTITIKESTGLFFQQASQLLFEQLSPIFSEEELGILIPQIEIYFPDTSPVTVSGLNNIPQSETDFTANEDYSIDSIDGFIKLSLNGSDYSLNEYIKQLPKPSVKVNYDPDDSSKITSFTSTTPAVSPPAPPVATSVTLSYTAKETIAFNETSQNTFNNRTHFYYHIEPFGFREIHPFITDDAISFLPLFDLDDSIAKDNGGELWIGLSNASPDKTFSILFQVSDGSANPLKNMTEVDWYYLSNNNWWKFPQLNVSDQTNNLTRSGVVLLTVPADATTANTRADDGLLWIKAVVDHDTDAVCKLIDVRANAAKAQFVQDLSKNIEFAKKLQANTISKPAIADAALKKTEQPFSSFDGRIREKDDQFYLRVSERLRHKHRAITAWDYERLVLQYFPQIHKAKCLNHTGFITDQKTNAQKYSETLPGHVTVITIPDLTNISSANPLRPYTSIGLLTEIQQYLHALTTPFLYAPPSSNVRLHVTNPQFEEVRFDFQVSFLPNHDPVFFTDLLNTEIEQFLTPWAFSGGDIEFGGKIEKSVVLNFVEERSYVDFVTCFKMYQFIPQDDGSKIQTADIDEAVASTARSILVSYYDEETKVKHVITSPANCSCDA